MSDLKRRHIYEWLHMVETKIGTATAASAARVLKEFYEGAEPDEGTQPEATAPAQDLSAAILALPEAAPAEIAKKGIFAYYWESGFREARANAAALASSANALSAGDRVDAETPASIVSNHEFMRALEAYTDTFPRAGKEALIDLRRTSDYGLVAAIDAAIQAQKDGHG